MRYEEFSPEELAERKQARPGTQEEYEDQLRKVKRIRDQEVARLLAGPDSETRRSLLEATDHAEEKLYTIILKRWARAREVRDWDASEQLFRSAQTSCRVDLWRKHGRVEVHDPAEVAKEYDTTQRSSVNTSSSEGRGRGWSRIMTELPGVDAHRPVLFSAVARRTIRVLVQRTEKPRLGGIRATIARYYEAVELAPAEPGTVGEDHPLCFVNDDEWRDELAMALQVSKRQIYEATAEIVRQIKKGFYLFVLLAPRRHAALQSQAMDRLLDVSHLGGHGLDATSRMLLQKAGIQLARAERMWVIPQASFLREARKLGRLQSRDDEDIVTLLHDSEAEYSAKVPKQTIPPTFQCIMRCAEHNP